MTKEKKAELKEEVEKALEEMCDDYCKFPGELNQEQIDMCCLECPLSRLEDLWPKL